MRRKIIRYVRRQKAALDDELQWRRERDNYPSIHFYTVHKAASSLFGASILGAIPGRRHVDYEAQIYEGTHQLPFQFEATGYVYGPIRITCEHTTDTDAAYQEIVDNTGFVRDRRIVCLIRDPRDVLVSSYYSFGFSHGISPVPELASHQKEHRKWARSKSVDEYCLARATAMNEIFRRLSELLDASKDSTLLRYEDMIDDWPTFSERLSRSLELEASTLKNLYRKSRPKKREELSAHHRSGRPGGFHEKLKAETVAELGRSLAGVLERFDYPRES